MRVQVDAPSASDPVADIILGDICELDYIWLDEVLLEKPRESGHHKRDDYHDEDSESVDGEAAPLLYCGRNY